MTRPSSVISPCPPSIPSFLLGSSSRSYKSQYSNIYFQRLHALRGPVERNAEKRWKDVKGSPVLVSRVLEVQRGQLCWIVGTLYMDMPLKPNILEDIGKDFSIPPPPTQSYRSGEDSVVLEDESGRISLVGERLQREHFVTGIVTAALGLETSTGEFEVLDLCFAGMAPQAGVEKPTISTESEAGRDSSTQPPAGSWIALLSGLELSTSHPRSSETELRLQILIEYILSECGGVEDQAPSSRISRVIIVGNSMLVGEDPVKYRRNSGLGPSGGADSSPATSTFSKSLLEISLAVPVQLLPGPSDPSGTLLPQQPMPRAMFGQVRHYDSFECETNPTYTVVDGKVILATSGQTLDDIHKYSESNDRLAAAIRTLEWRHMAPTAPDTLWCHPYFLTDPFVLNSTPHIYIIGNQPTFATRLVKTSPFLAGNGGNSITRKRYRDEDVNECEDVRCRVVLLPKFCESPTLVLVHTGTLECKTIEIGADLMLAIKSDDP